MDSILDLRTQCPHCKNVYQRSGALESHLRRKHADKPLFSREDIQKPIRERLQNERTRLPTYNHSDEEELVEIEPEVDSLRDSDTNSSDDGPERVPGLCRIVKWCGSTAAALCGLPAWHRVYRQRLPHNETLVVLITSQLVATLTISGP